MSSQQRLQGALQQEQQRAMVQGVIAKLSEMCFDMCIKKPDSKLSSSEQSCVSNCVNRYLDTSVFVAQRMMKKQ